MSARHTPTALRSTATTIPVRSLPAVQCTSTGPGPGRHDPHDARDLLRRVRHQVPARSGSDVCSTAAAGVLGVTAAAGNLVGAAPEEDRDTVASVIRTSFGTALTPLALGARI